MSWQTRLMTWVNHFGTSATLSVITGTVCPCMSYKNRDSYSPEYHATYPEADDCIKTGLIDRTTTQTTFKGILFSPLSKNDIPGVSEYLEAIGNIQQSDLICIGNVKTDGTLLSFIGATDYTHFVTYDSNDYYVRDVQYLTEKQPGQISRLVRKS